MRVAILSPITWRTPPRKYGPWEQVASTIAEGLVARGISVSLFATGDSLTHAKLESVCKVPIGEDQTLDPKVWECLHISHLMEKAKEFDIIHNHFDFLPLTYSALIDTPMITTIHGFSSPQILPVYKKYNKTSAYISISKSDRHRDLSYLQTIHHGINPEDFPFIKAKEDYLLCFGRIHPDKGTHLAIEIALAAGLPLKI
ncbi:MAG: glycosyltransferase, partial [Marinoscillum sp.]